VFYSVPQNCWCVRNECNNCWRG